MCNNNKLRGKQSEEPNAILQVRTMLIKSCTHLALSTCFLFLSFAVLGVKSRTLYRLGKHSTTELYFQPKDIFKDEMCKISLQMSICKDLEDK
jgi:hypothetical protein